MNKYKYVLAAFATLLSKLGILVSCIWVVVEFTLYLVKDKEFNWWSIWAIPILTIASFVFPFLPNGKCESRFPKKKSGFQMKLEEEMKKREEAIKKNKK